MTRMTSMTATDFTASEAFAREMVAAFSEGAIGEAFEPYFLWKTNRAPLVSITTEQADRMSTICANKVSTAPRRLRLYLSRIAYELSALRRAGMVVRP